MEHPGQLKDLVVVAFDRGHKIWNAGERAGFPAAIAAALVEAGTAHYPETGEGPALSPQLGTRTSGMLSCSRCGAYYAEGEVHACAPGPPAGPEVFDAGFPEQRPRWGRGRPRVR